MSSTSPALTRATPSCRDELDLVTSLGHALAHATCLAAADPDAELPAGSLAERVRTAYSRFRPDGHPDRRTRARERLSQSPEQLREDFGDYADWTPERARELDAALLAKLGSAVRARLEPQLTDLDTLASSLGLKPKDADWTLTKTWLEAGYFTGDIVASWKELTISYPTKVQFKWATDEPEAEKGVWQLFRVDPGNKEVLIASGTAGDAPGGIFALDLSKYLPAAPPAVPKTYHVRVSPQTKMSVKPGNKPGVAGPKVLGKAVGPHSDAIVITYSAITGPPVDLTVYEIYRKLRFRLPAIHMVEDQTGPGTEEFWVAGFVQELVPSGSASPGKQVKFGPHYTELDPDGPTDAPLPFVAEFQLPFPDAPLWPRAYVVVVSVIEEDDGGAISDWQAELGQIAADLLSGPAATEAGEFLQQQFEDYIEDNWDDLLAQTPALAQYIGSALGSSAGAIVGMAIMVATLVIAAIVSGADDDFYGIDTATIALPTNIVDFVQTLPGTELPTGYQLETVPFVLLGQSSYPVAANWDGKVQIDHECKLGGLEIY